MNHTIEARPYGPDSTSAEIEALRAQVFIYKDDIIMMVEVPVPSEFQIDTMFDRIEELIREHDCIYLIVDLERAGRPTAKMRDQLRARFKRMPQLKHVAIFTGKNVLLNIAAKFAMSGVIGNYTIHKTLTQAEEVINHAKK